MFIFIASVHHTGTQFTEKILLDAGYGPTDKPEKGGNKENNDYHRAHIAHSVQTELKDWLERKFPLIVPLRHPVDVAMSWKARKKPIKQMVAQFELLQELVLPYNPYLLPIDHDMRDIYFQVIRENIDANLKTDWAIWKSKRKGSDHVAQLEVPAFDGDDICDIQTLTNMPFLHKLYPTPWLL